MANSGKQDLKAQYYRRSLPSTCIDFSSAEGKQIFKEAINGIHMNCFYNLAAQFRTQDEPAYCGLTTLVMVLNALSVDPGKVWKGPWRWYHENMLDCCIPLYLAKKQGINLFQFMCLAKCNGLDVDMVQVTQSASIEEFRNLVKRITQCDNEVLVCSYSRKDLEQTGDGHYSPIGGYHAGCDLILIFDVARFKYPPHWISVEMMWKAMQSLDKDTGQPRGYLVLKQTTNTGISTVIFKISKKFNFMLGVQPEFAVTYLTQQWWAWLAKQRDTNNEEKEFFKILVSTFLDIWCSEDIPDSEQLLGIDTKCLGELSEQHKLAISELINALEKQNLFRVVEDFFKSEECLPTAVSATNKQCMLCSSKNETRMRYGIERSHFVTMVLLSWPYKSLCSEETNSNAVYASQYICQEMSGANQLLCCEVQLLKDQFASMFCYYCSAKDMKVC